MKVSGRTSSGNGRARKSSRNRKTDHGKFSPDQIIQKPVGSIKPAPENDEFYKPVSRKDPDIIALAASIKEYGVKEPLVVSLDNVLISGHRRLCAAKLAGLKTVPVRVEQILSTDPKFLKLLREANRQRVKTFAETMREQVFDADPEESYRAMTEHREQQANVDVDEIEIVGHKVRSEISDARRPFLEAISKILNDRRKYWPLSVRQVHYQLLNNPPLIHASKPGSRYTNTMKSYKAAIDLIARARTAGEISWKAIDDETRPINIWKVYPSTAPFVAEQLDGFMKGFYRDLQQSQPNQIEIVGEKNTVASILRPVASEYRIPLTTGRGYSSLSPRFKMAERFRKSGKEKLIILFVSDFDPEGEDIPHSFARSMRDDFDIAEVVAIKVALNREQIDELGLPPGLKAKKTSSRRNGFVRNHGENVFELEAVEPPKLQDMLRETIDSVIDVKAFNAEIDAEKRDAAHFDKIRRAAQEVFAGMDFDSK